MWRLSPFSVTLFLLFFPTHVSASLIVSEVFYDAEGKDDGREWVEVYNTGSTSIEVGRWRFRESGVNHKLVAVSGSSIEPGGYAVIADKPEQFKVDWPNFSGTVFDSSFSLKNTGELIELIDENGAVAFGVSYSQEAGATGDGNSLNFENGSWRAAMPSPGHEASRDAFIKLEAAPEPRNLPAESVVEESVAIDGGEDERVLAASYAAEPNRETRGSGIMPWITLLAFVIGIGVVALVMRKRTISGYEITEDEA